jgi:hypothetical protein
LTTAQRIVLMRATLWLAAVRLALWLAPLPRVWSWFCKSEHAHGGRSIPRAEVATIRWAVQAAGRRMPGATCLVRALTLRHLLQQIGVPSQVRFGVASSAPGTIMAHAWVEVENSVISNGDDLSRFKALPILKSKRP